MFLAQPKVAIDAIRVNYDGEIKMTIKETR